MPASTPTAAKRARPLDLPGRAGKVAAGVLTMFTVSLDVDAPGVAEVVGDLRPGGPDLILLLHGWQRTSADWDPLLPELEGGDAILRIDLPGFGRTPEPAIALGSAGYAEAVASAVGKLASGEGFERIYAVGHSFGGRVAIQMAARSGGILAGAVLAGTPVLKQQPARKPPLLYGLVRNGVRRGILPPAVLDRARRRYGSADYNNANGVMREVLVKVVNESYLAELAACTVPVELVAGELDTAAPARQAVEAAEAASTAEVVVVAGAGHMLPLSHPAEIAAALARIRVRSGGVGRG